MRQIIEIILLKNKKVVFLSLVLTMISCDDSIEFTQYKSLANSSWEAHKKISFEFDVADTIGPRNLFIHIRNTKDYEYSNLYVITSLKFPNGITIVDTLQYEMANEKGVFLGKGFSNLKENKLFYKEAKVFPEKGDYTFSIYHAMRKQGEVTPIENLEGIQDVGFSIEK